MKYKVGDTVRVKSLEWYNENKDKFGSVKTPNNIFVPDMSRFCGQECIICEVLKDASCNKTYYGLKEDVSGFSWTDDMFEELVEEGIDGKDDIDPLHELCQSKLSAVIIESDVFKDEVELILNDYEIEVRDGKTFAVKQKPKYPTTYEECCKVLGVAFVYTDIMGVTNKEYDLYLSFIELIRCRDAYWKIAGEQMGIDKSWEFENPSRHYVFTIEYSGGKIILNAATDSMLNRILVFPTKEMRDAFFENFKDLIEKCKELL